MVEDVGEGRETGVEGVVQARRAGGHEGEAGCEDKQGAAVGEVSICGGEEMNKEVLGKVSTDGDGEN